MDYNNFLNIRKNIIEKEFSRMNDMQKKAVFRIKGPLLILAGAGSGKTTVLVNRISNLLKYGDAYNTEKSSRTPDEYDVELMQRYLAGDSSVYHEIRDVLSYDAPMPWQILAITFTNKAANELKERLVKMLGDNAADIWACTFHSACLRILRRNGDKLGFSSHFTIYDTDDSKRVMKECQKLLGVDDKFLSHKTILNEISRAKDSLISPDDYLKSAGNDVRLRKMGECYKKYQQLLKNADAMDFDDIIANTVALLQNEPDVLDYYQNRFKYIMVDEYQDTNHAQYVLTSLLADKYKNICVVGDDDQSIYRFRGATIENILSFENRYEDAVVIRLEQNYRSTQNILDAANAVIANNTERKGKNLWTANGSGEKIELSTAADETDEARYIAEQILNSVAKGRKWSDHAVLYRMNAMSNSIERALVKNAIPYRIIGGHKFYDRAEIKDIHAYLNVINNPSDSVRLRRIINVPKRGIGDSTVAKAGEIAETLGITLYEVLKTADQYEVLKRTSGKLIQFTAMMDRLMSLSETEGLPELYDSIIEETGYVGYLRSNPEKFDDRMQNINELKSNLVRYEEDNEDATLNDYLEEIALLTDIDNYNASEDAVVLMTLHSAKGLEFPVVFMPGLEEGIFPGIQSMYNETEVEEERRLAYVGITRAKEKLYITKAKSRMLYGSTNYFHQSRFISEIPENLLNIRQETGFRAMAGLDRAAKHSPYVASAREHHIDRGFSGSGKASPKVTTGDIDYKVGDTVIHKVFGEGVITKTTSMGNDLLLEIAFVKAGTKKIMARLAKLQKV